MMDNSNWILKRLSTVKQNSESWSQLAGGLQSTINEVIEPVIAKFTSMRSLFTATDEDLTLIENDLGAFFRVDRSLSGKDKAVSLMAKQDDINYKSTLKPMKDKFKREFKGLAVEWSPLYAHVTIAENPYGTGLLTKRQMIDIGVNVDDYFLTSRGVIKLDANKIATLGYTITQFSIILRDIISNLRPIHIVYDGEDLFLLYSIVDIPSKASISAREVFKVFPPLATTENCGESRLIERLFPELESTWNKSEYFNLDELPVDVFPMDTPLNAYGEVY
jgi:hypothetical protein